MTYYPVVCVTPAAKSGSIVKVYPRHLMGGEWILLAK